MSIPPGTHLGRYEIHSQIGAGGMGEVYLAEDVRLNRRVALKILPKTLAADEERMRRFVQEAQSASALNHPNILTIHEIGTDGAAHFIATEYVEGETLRNRLQSEPASLKSALDVAVQIASALQAAHGAGIVHRDIKPENVMIRPDGLVKLLDFGIAKLTEKRSESVDGEAATAIKAETSPGLVIGTAAYMSPEQARGQVVDARSDIFSFGVVLYEMIAGKRPFTGANAIDVIGSILNKEPKPVHQQVAEVPHEIERIIGKTLRKDRDERYQTVKDLLLDLKDVKQELEFQNKLERTASPPHREEAKTQIINAVVTNAADAPPSTSSTERVVSGIKQHRRGFTMGAGVLLIAAIALGFWFYNNRSSLNAAPIESIAVLPFVNESGNADVEYLSDGMTESLINSLSQLPKLAVKARSSVFRYKGKDATPQTIAMELSVQAILNGRVVQRGEDLVLYLSLVDARNGNQIWGEQYNRKLTDLVSLQSEIARDVSQKLQLKLSSEEKKQLTDMYPNSNEAYQLYLKGRFFWNKRTEEGLKAGMGYFEQAISKDPGYAFAYVGLADSYNVLGFYSFLPPKESFPKAKAAASKALELNEELAEAHNSLAYATLYYDWDFATAEREFIRAIELKPNYPVAHQWYGNLLTAMGRWDEAIQEFRRAQELDPLSLVITAVPGWTYYYARQYDKAIEPCQKAIDMDRNFALAHNWLGQVYERKGMYERAISEFKEALSLSGGSPEIAALLAHAYAVSGNKRQAQVILDDLLELSKRRYVSPYHIATIYAGLGDKDRALEWLDTAYNDRQNILVFLKHDARMDNLRSDPRFGELLRGVGLIK